jgi:3-hydroxymyristoyl/3-hydroxydecanoyl-(acyl carrier protein) dehydratase
MKWRLVDRILAWEPRRRICGIKNVSFEEYELKRSLGEEPCLPESLLVESLFQLGNWLVILSSDFTRMGLILRVEEVCFLERLRTGGCLEMDVQVCSWRDDGLLFDGQARSRDRLLATGRGCLALPVPLEEFQNPDDLRVLLSEIYRPESASS